MGSTQDNPVFENKDDEIDFWKAQTNDLQCKLAESREELGEFRESSRELEEELEAQLQQHEQRARELSNRLTHTHTENQQLKERLDKLQRETHGEISELQSDLGQVNSVCDRLNKYVRELEQQNDDLERCKRTLLVSLEDFEGRLNQALERNAFLESELDEKEGLRDVVQRLKDECRDLRQELAVKQRCVGLMDTHNNVIRHHSTAMFDNNNTVCDGIVPAASDGHRLSSTSNTSAGNTATKFLANKRISLPVSAAGSGSGSTSGSATATVGSATPAPVPASLSTAQRVWRSMDAATGSGGVAAATLVAPPHATTPAITASDTTVLPISPGSRVSALNIVGDLLRKVGALECKLATCKSYVARDNVGSNVSGLLKSSSSGGSVGITAGAGANNVTTNNSVIGDCVRSPLQMSTRKPTRIPTQVHN